MKRTNDKWRIMPISCLLYIYIIYFSIYKYFSIGTYLNDVNDVSYLFSSYFRNFYYLKGRKNVCI